MNVLGDLDQFLPPILRMTLKPDNLRHGLQVFQSHPAGVALIALSLFLVVLAVVRALTGVVTFVYVNFLRPGVHLQRYGSWAVVTG
jgi:hypothetical protein